ncbi:hypothetical protein ACIPUO_17825 [Pectobacterium carotovorum]
MAEGSSGALIQCLAVAVSVTKLDKVMGLEYYLTFIVAVVAALGFLA